MRRINLFICFTMIISLESPGQTLQERLGYAPADRLLIIHADDLGMCHSVNAGVIRSLEEGNVNSASIMMPCGWVPEMIDYIREHPETDIGIHLTLNSEWKTLRWSSVSPKSSVNSLLDPLGYFLSRMQETRGQSERVEFDRELRAQVDFALRLGLRPSHLDTHLGTIFERKDFFETALAIAKDYRIPLMVPDPTPALLRRWGNRDYLDSAFIQSLKSSGIPLLAGLYSSTQEGSLEATLQEYKRILRNLSAGVSQIILHLAEESDELKAMTPTWRIQTSDYAFAMDPEVKQIIQEAGIKLVTWRAIQSVWHSR